MAGAASQACSARVVGGHLAVAELQARVTILTVAGTVRDHLGHAPGAVAREGWPNALDRAGYPARPSLEAGRSNSPRLLRKPEL